MSISIHRDREGDDENSQWIFDTIREAPAALRPSIPTGNGPTVSHVTGDQRTNDSGHNRLSNGVEHNEEGSPPPHPKRISPRNSEFSAPSSEMSAGSAPPPLSSSSQPNGIPGHTSSDGLHPHPVSIEMSTEDELRARALSVTEETRVLDEALSRTSTASLEASTEVTTLPQSQLADRSKFEKLESSLTSMDVEMASAGGGGGAEAMEDEVRRKAMGGSSLQDEDSHVRCDYYDAFVQYHNIHVYMQAPKPRSSNLYAAIHPALEKVYCSNDNTVVSSHYF